MRERINRTIHRIVQLKAKVKQVKQTFYARCHVAKDAEQMLFKPLSHSIPQLSAACKMCFAVWSVQNPQEAGDSLWHAAANLRSPDVIILGLWCVQKCIPCNTFFTAHRGYRNSKKAMRQ